MDKLKLNQWNLRIGDLQPKLPIIQGGMGVGISLSGLASAVANEGGIGVIATAGLGLLDHAHMPKPVNMAQANIDVLKREIRRAREMSRGILGVNIMVALTNFADMVKTAVQEKVDIIFSGAGLPLNLPQFLNGRKTKLVPIVSSARAALIIIKRWLDKYNYLPDAVVVEGPKAGGHLGFKRESLEDEQFSLECLAPEVVEAVKPYEKSCDRKIPVIAAGGIYTGEDIYNILQKGVSGVQMATRFVTTHECDADEAFKQAYLDAEEKDIVIIKSPVGMPGRAIRNRFIDDVENGKKKPFQCPFQCIITCDYKESPYCIALALKHAQQGQLKKGFAFAGANAYRSERIISVKELIADLTTEFDRAADQAAAVDKLESIRPAGNAHSE